MATNKLNLQHKIRTALSNIADLEFQIITATNAPDQALAMVEKSIWQTKLDTLEHEYRRE